VALGSARKARYVLGVAAACPQRAIMPASLHAYAHLEDAWAGGVEAWCRASTEQALTSGARSWLVCATRGQSEWVKARLLRAGVPIVGLEFHDASSLRRHLCQRFGLEAPEPGREILDLLVRWQAFGDSSAQAITRNPRAWLETLAELSSRGWLEDNGVQSALVPKSLASFVRSLADSPAWLPGIDRRLLAAAQADAKSAATPIRLAVLGTDASFSSLAPLLFAAARAAASSEVFLPLPRAGAEQLHEAWQEAWESELRTEAVLLGASHESPYDALIRRLEGTDLDTEAKQMPALLVGATWADEVELIAQTIANWLVEHAELPEARLSVVLAGRGATSIALGQRLASLGIAHDDTLGERPEPGMAVQLLRALIDYHRESASGGALLRLVAVRESARQDGRLAQLERTMTSAHEITQSSHARHLVRDGFGKTLVDALGEWRGVTSIQTAKLHWQSALSALDLGELLATQMDAVLVPAWSALQREFASDAAIELELLLDFLNDAVAAIPAARYGPGRRTRHARVVLTTLPDAASRTWHACLLADANEGIWPLATTEDPLLPDDRRIALNEERGSRLPLLTQLDRTRFEESALLSLLDHCECPFWFASSRRKADAPNQEAHPNEWILRCLVESGGTKPAESWAALATSVTMSSSGGEDLEMNHVRRIHALRRKPDHPFDEYFHNYEKFAGRASPAAPIRARDLQLLEDAPAQLAIKLVFGEESRRGLGAFERSVPTALGRLLHQWLEEALRDAPDRILSRALLDRATTEGVAAARRSHEQTLRAALQLAADEPLPSWWSSVLAQAERAARRCLGNLRESGLADETFTIATERKLEHSLAAANGNKLSLKGRVDLLLESTNDLFILDYKSGKGAADISTKRMLKHGRDLQFLAYLWLAQARRADGLHVRVVTTTTPADEDLLTNHNLADFQPLLDTFALMQSRWVFGQRSGLSGEYATCEVLPLATVPIAARVLAEKARVSKLIVPAPGEDDED
jgi:PD-(D/E)XK nuclease superfamily